MSDDRDPVIIPKAVEKGTRLKAGVHNVVITGIELKRDFVNHNGELCLEVVFENSNNHIHRERFWVRDPVDLDKIDSKSQWRFDAMCEAAGINNKEQSLVKSAALGARLWLCLKHKYHKLPTGGFDVDERGNKKHNVEAFSFGVLDDASKEPEIEGSPELDKDGLTSGAFYSEWIKEEATTQNQAKVREASKEEGSEIEKAFSGGGSPQWAKKQEGADKKPISDKDKKPQWSLGDNASGGKQEEDKGYPKQWD